MIKHLFIYTLAALSVVACHTNFKSAGDWDIFVGTYGEAIYEYSYNPLEGTFEELAVIPSADASYIALGDRNAAGERVLYAVSEQGDASHVYSYAETALGEWRRTGSCDNVGADPCYILSIPGVPYVFTADYSGGDLSVFAAPDGVITGLVQRFEYEDSGVPGRQAEAHVHQVRALPADLCTAAGLSGTWLAATDLGNDALHFFRLTDSPESPLEEDTEATFKFNPGTGPRHMEFDPSRCMMFIVSELSDECIALDLSSENGSPRLALKQQYTAARTFAAGGADIHLSPDGEHLFTSHRLQDDGISMMDVGQAGELTQTGYVNTGAHPRAFAFIPDGTQVLVASRDAHCIQVFPVDATTGAISDCLYTLETGSDRPVCIAFDVR